MWIRLLRAASGRREQGQAMFIFAAALAGLIGLVGMAVDVGQVVWTRTDLQKIADAAALAGAQDLPKATTTAAAASAQSYGALNGASSLSISFTTTTKTNDTISVTATRSVDYWFLPVIGLDGTSVSATAKVKAVQSTVTGYSWANVATFVIWGGSRQTMVNAGDASCPLYVCVGSSYTFLDTGWMSASGTPTTPDWTANNSNNFKGDINHGNGANVNHVGEFITMGGLGNVTAPTVGSFIVIPVIDKASGNSNARTMRIAAWVVVKVDSGCKKQQCRGTVQSPATTTAPAGWSTSGTSQPPTSLQYLAPATGQLIN